MISLVSIAAGLGFFPKFRLPKEFAESPSRRAAASELPDPFKARSPLPNPGNAASTHLRKLTSSVVPSSRVMWKYLKPLVLFSFTAIDNTPGPTFCTDSG